MSWSTSQIFNASTFTTIVVVIRDATAKTLSVVQGWFSPFLMKQNDLVYDLPLTESPAYPSDPEIMQENPRLIGRHFTFMYSYSESFLVDRPPPSLPLSRAISYS